MQDVLESFEVGVFREFPVENVLKRLVDVTSSAGAPEGPKNTHGISTLRIRDVRKGAP